MKKISRGSVIDEHIAKAIWKVRITKNSSPKNRSLNQTSQRHVLLAQIHVSYFKLIVNDDASLHTQIT